MAVTRHLELSLARAMETAHVVVLEGARAVGKSTTARALVEQRVVRSYQTFADPTTRAAAEADPTGWLRSLVVPAVVDESQLVAGLTLAVKELTDERNRPGQFLLTGSATRDNREFGGADPLARRAQHFRMDPLTMSEIDSSRFGRGSLVDELFDGDPSTTWHGSLSATSLVDTLRKGGFPTIALPGAPLGADALHAQVRADIRATLSDHVLDDERFDRYRAEEVLRMLITLPGNIVNTSSVGSALGIDRRTVERYLAVLERRFLVRILPNFASRPQMQDRSRSKVHPVDSSFSVTALHETGRGVEQHREQLGAVLESHVVNQVLAHREWARVETAAFYWRDPQTRREVDLVLRDTAGRVVGLEVKAAGDVNLADFRGLRALEESTELHRGYVIYTGDRAVRFGENLWALPFTSLGDGDAFLPADPANTGARIHMTPEVALPTARIFLSYSHDDDRYFDGAVIAFANDLVAAYSTYYGDDLALFVDREGLSWGEDWSTRLNSELGTNDFLLAIVSPRYLKSASCRDELLEFVTAAKGVGEPRLLLSLIWIEPPNFEGADRNDPVVKAIKESQYLTGTHLRDLKPGTIEYRQALEQLAARLHQTIERRGADAAPLDAPADDSDVFEKMARFEALKEPLQDAVREYGDAFTDLTSTLTANPLPRDDAAAMPAAFMRIGREMAGPSERLNVASRLLTKTWSEIDEVLADVVAVFSRLPDSAKATLRDPLEALHGQLSLPGIEEIGGQLQMLGGVSRHLRPMSDAMRGAIETLVRIRTSAGAWVRALS